VMKTLGFVAWIWLAVLPALADTPKLNIRTKSDLPKEKERKAQIERLARQYDLKKYTLTREIMIDRGAVNHSAPVLTLNLRFLDDDDLALSAYVHEQGHWVLMERHRADNPGLFAELRAAFPSLPIAPPEGDGELRSSYFHIVVCMLEWQALEDLLGLERARKIIEWKKDDHYKAVHSLLLNQRPRVEAILNCFHVKR
jgi:hypothetical protein